MPPLVIDRRGVEMGMFCRHVRVGVWHFGRVVAGPQPHAHDRRQRGQRAEGEEAGIEPYPRAHPAGHWVSDEPAGMRQGELRGEEGRSVFFVGGAPQQPARRCLCQRIADAEQQPQRHQHLESPDRQWPEEETGCQQPGTEQHDPSIRQPLQQLGQPQGHQHGPCAKSCQRAGREALAELQLALHEHDGVDDDHGARRRDGQVQRQQPAQPRRGQIDAAAARRTLVDAAARRLFGLGQHGRHDEQRRRDETHDGAEEEAVESDDRQQHCGKRRTAQALQVVGQAGQRQCFGVVRLLGKHVGDGGLEGGRECGRGGLQHEDQHIDLPDLSDERQQQGDRCAHQVQSDEQSAAGQLFGEGGGHRRNADVGQHLDGQRRAKDRPGVCPCQVVGQQAQGDRGQACADQSDDLSEEEMPIGAVGEDVEHGASPLILNDLGRRCAHRGGRISYR
mmetsp:Transcript_53139/g.124386  ORF Transcript_53139/g.124386 Transcript_53139/m.124386 type:complete len:448 (+) Transcript_53139:344-1687(+)